MVQAALYQLVLDRKVRRIRTARRSLADRLRQPRIRPRRRPPHADAAGIALRPSGDQGRCGGLAAPGGRRTEFRGRDTFLRIQMRPGAVARSSTRSRREKAFPCPRTWHMISNIVQRRGGLDPVAERALFRGTVGEAAAVEFSAFLQGLARAASSPGRHRRSRECDRDPRQRQRADRALRLALPHGRRHQPRRHRHLRHKRLRREIGEFLVGSCIRREPGRCSARPAFIQLGRRPHPVTPPFWENDTMNLTHDAMLVSLRISSLVGPALRPQGEPTMSPSITRPPPAPGATTNVPPAQGRPSPRSPPP